MRVSTGDNLINYGLAVETDRSLPSVQQAYFPALAQRDVARKLPCLLSQACALPEMMWQSILDQVLGLRRALHTYTPGIGCTRAWGPPQ